MLGTGRYCFTTDWRKKNRCEESQREEQWDRIFQAGCWCAGGGGGLTQDGAEEEPEESDTRLYGFCQVLTPAISRLEHLQRALLCLLQSSPGAVDGVGPVPNRSLQGQAI